MSIVTVTSWIVLVALALCATSCAANATPRCATSADCMGGSACYRGFCIAATALDAAGRDAGGCPPGQARCDDRCVDLQTSRDHCGECETRCEGGADRCVGGHCVEHE